jgi:hypothetical protein
MHSTQKQIVKNLTLHSNATYAQILIPELDPKTFVYHLGKLMEAKFVKYNSISRKYSLTTKGKTLAMYITEYNELEFHATNVFIGLCIYNNDRLLVVKRKHTPYLNYVGIPTFGTDSSKLLIDSAQDALQSLGLAGKLQHSFLFETLYSEKENPDIITTHSNMHVFVCNTPKGTVITENSEGNLYWTNFDELLNEKLGYRNSKDLIQILKSNHFPKEGEIKVISYKDTEAEF